MDRRRDKLGEYVMVAEEYNRYEEFAASATNYATVDEAHPTVTGSGTFDLYRANGDPAGDERRVLVRADHIYGAGRPIERLIFDIVHASSAWLRTSPTLATSIPGMFYVPWGADLYVKVRPILTDFDPATVTWDDAYVTTPLSFGSQATILIAGEGTGASMLVLTLAAQNPASASAEVHETLWVPDLFATKAWDINTVLAAWNAEDEIYGWEISVDTDNYGVSIAWTGGGLDSPYTRSFVIKK
jgi:hypothetical protein